MSAPTARTAPLKVAVIVGSVRQGRFAPTVANWFAGFAGHRDDLVLDVVDLADEPLGQTLGGVPEDLGPRAERLTARLTEADAFVVITPEYNHSFPASLKNLIDAHYAQWRAKPVGFVSYGGLGGGLRAVEQLRLVFAELHAVTMRDSVSFHSAGQCFGDDGSPLDPTVPEGAAKGMLDQLVWWGTTLRDAKATRPYGI
ncbi:MULTISPECIES: NADPH-dependent FMN reductase [Streptomycetaceae]|uniref:NADPH-dependent FMN reductase n=1 Tax=Streptantibioticus cattleyicolor (strain ATCC 35852 / DSM 46488 / JCM 4925 / NBRC 14057 / NRRL 8057) TaxID=1003195 RepID=F8JRI8_STREN|nr:MULTISPECIES: NAD(P)H-dependent oxidoreductase [Streptomycetaceae]AEW97875.1 NADPH-dependent FMN reductase [Streptantibioticus cattleyicolor NRRL 8057 = DSM 46488]MYS62284.1 NADPH-dependent FMN reductase [Streptomyces sp. SID5468]CCB78189.1 Reductase [Streptantibioticus cattleyicolor NRRL 8057 = DSM 46488]